MDYGVEAVASAFGHADTIYKIIRYIIDNRVPQRAWAELTRINRGEIQRMINMLPLPTPRKRKAYVRAKYKRNRGYPSKYKGVVPGTNRVKYGYGGGSAGRYYARDFDDYWKNWQPAVETPTATESYNDRNFGVGAIERSGMVGPSYDLSAPGGKYARFTPYKRKYKKKKCTFSNRTKAWTCRPYKRKGIYKKRWRKRKYSSYHNRY